MNEFGYIADDLTFLEERLDSPDLAGYAAGLKRALQKAFIEACKASREMRLTEAERPKPSRRAKQSAAKARPALVR